MKFVCHKLGTKSHNERGSLTSLISSQKKFRNILGAVPLKPYYKGFVIPGGTRTFLISYELERALKFGISKLLSPGSATSNGLGTSWHIAELLTFETGVPPQFGQ